MAWARFTADFDWPRTGPWHIAYKAGHELNVRRACLEAAVAAGKAEAIAAPPRGERRSSMIDDPGMRL